MHGMYSIVLVLALAGCGFKAPAELTGDQTDATTVGTNGNGSGPSATDADGDGRTAGAADCDDTDPDVYQGHPEICDGKDNDCNGEVDDLDPNLRTTPCEAVDEDNDGRTAEVDCNDHDANVHPDAPEVCDNTVDDDCDGDVDGDDTECGAPVDTGVTDTGTDDTGATGPTDCDGDGRTSAIDCDDYDADVHPDHAEVCGDDKDNNCDAVVDEDCEIDTGVTDTGTPVDTDEPVDTGVTDTGAPALAAGEARITVTGFVAATASREPAHLKLWSCDLTTWSGCGAGYMSTNAPILDATATDGMSAVIAVFDENDQVKIGGEVYFDPADLTKTGAVCNGSSDPLYACTWDYAVTPSHVYLTATIEFADGTVQACTSNGSDLLCY